MFKRYCLFFTLAVGLQAADFSSSWYGTWKMDASKSHSKILKSITLIIRREGENDVLESSGVDAQGNPMKERRTQPHGGGKVVIVPSEPEHFDETTLTIPDDHNVVYTYKKNGKITAEQHVTLSADGKSAESRFTVMAKTPDGKADTDSVHMVKQ
jgi:hypothetical protein